MYVYIIYNILMEKKISAQQNACNQHIYTYMCIRIYVYIYKCMYVYMYTYICMYICNAALTARGRN